MLFLFFFIIITFFFYVNLSLYVEHGYTDFSWEYKLRIHGLFSLPFLFSVPSEETDVPWRNQGNVDCFLFFTQILFIASS